MIEITTKIMIDASPNQVWKIISEINDDSKFWKGMMKIRNLSKEGNVINREVTLKNTDKCHQKIILFHMEGIHIRWTRGAINGIKDIMITPIGKQTLLKVEMNYKIRGVASLFSRDVSEDLLNEAELAMQLIKEEVEKKEPTKIELKMLGCIHG
jgi:Polyketide cyclase / dehydrase and lipid transport